MSHMTTGAGSWSRTLSMQLFIDLGGKIKIQFGAYLALIGSLIATAGGALNVIPMFKK